MWRSPVARVLWEHDAAGSNPVTPTISSVHSQSDERSIFFLPILDCLEQGFYSFCYAVVGRQLTATPYEHSSKKHNSKTVNFFILCLLIYPRKKL